MSFAPYLDQLSHQLQHQYLLTFIPKPEKKAGMQRVRLATEVRGVELMLAAERLRSRDTRLTISLQLEDACGAACIELRPSRTRSGDCRRTAGRDE